MGVLGGTWLIFQTQLSTVLRSKRALVCLLLALSPAVVAMAPPRGIDASEVVWLIGMMFILQLIAPLIGLIAGSAVLTEEIENRTITYAFTRPVPRVALFLGRYLATLLLVAALLAGSSYLLVTLAPMKGRVNDLPSGILEQLTLASLLAGALYALLTAGLGVFVKRPMIVGLFYLIAMEGLLANLPGSSQKLTLQYYLRGVFTRLGVEENAGLRGVDFITQTEFLSPAESVLRLVVMMALVIGVCTYGIRRRQYVLTS